MGDPTSKTPPPVTIEHEVVIFVKGNIYGSAGFWTNGTRFFVGSCDPRCHPSIFEREYTHREDAEHSFSDHIKANRRAWLEDRLSRSGLRRLEY
ncbi:MAG TPA: hypothetical protein VGO43_06190 [Pyrinomonadaceae bacterium]|jgi:hypothetical protein|nr:hypothetical protein [Pyrinomonadaceae bacterium]